MIALKLLHKQKQQYFRTLKTTGMKNQSFRPFDFLNTKNLLALLKKSTRIVFAFCILILLILAMPSFNKKMNKNTKGKITIVDIKDGGIDPDITTVSHKPLEVLVFRILLKEDSFMGKPAHQMYSIKYFRTENDTLTGYKAWLVTDDNFKKADYTWLNDSTFSLRLYNKATKKEHTTVLFGYHGTSGIRESQVKE